MTFFDYVLLVLASVTARFITTYVKEQYLSNSEKKRAVAEAVYIATILAIILVFPSTRP